MCHCGRDKKSVSEKNKSHKLAQTKRERERTTASSYSSVLAKCNWIATNTMHNLSTVQKLLLFVFYPKLVLTREKKTHPNICIIKCWRDSSASKWGDREKSRTSECIEICSCGRSYHFNSVMWIKFITNLCTQNPVQYLFEDFPSSSFGPWNDNARLQFHET